MVVGGLVGRTVLVSAAMFYCDLRLRWHLATVEEALLCWHLKNHRQGNTSNKTPIYACLNQFLGQHLDNPPK